MTRFLSVVPRLPVRDLDRTVAWYKSVLAFEGEAMWPGDAPTFALLERDSASVQFYVADPSSVPATGHATINLQVDDALAMYQAIADLTAVEWGPEVYWYGRREFAIRDPDGYLVIISEETADAPTCVDQ